ncbi:Reversal of tor2 lethality [Friedmanniomyces endolithicus]|uniref:Protein ROT1 n=2 Tax=Dothideomycetidae TaxID=451867 RepID=A0A4U0UUR3_9PEZI|nr:Reversal of tor2 lethality [Friedmanniomyces endolithicus]KAK5142306.1 Reversal of tor2 lethality [Rachicladosporium monterosium]KAK0284919.1 Reversal of tor2 lethality [Friedmanniomyces endolithicus]KAK0293650.1 Reversal of tor2 lethality [Friedmanniomyces endolithicus]KAK0324165.1 Reversal of tor2 lethality [Friedmanniomyces endolithicus]
MLLYTSLATALLLAAPAAAQTWPYDLIGTWSTKSNQTLTGPGFYDPLNERLIEPSRTGISYSFTGDGHYEEAYYRAIANPQNPACPSGIMQWQHGTWVMNANGSLSLTPIAVDGRQLLSSPCEYNNAVYTRYNQTELFQRYSVYKDPYHGIGRLDMFKFDGAPMNPMYLVYSPPQMLPTTTLNPTSASSTAGATSTSGSKLKRGLDAEVPLGWKVKMASEEGKMGEGRGVVHMINADRVWWIGLGMMGIGGLLYLGPRRMGVQLS